MTYTLHSSVRCNMYAKRFIPAPYSQQKVCVRLSASFRDSL